MMSARWLAALTDRLSAFYFPPAGQQMLEQNSQCLLRYLGHLWCQFDDMRVCKSTSWWTHLSDSCLRRRSCLLQYTAVGYWQCDRWSTRLCGTVLPGPRQV